MVSKLHDILKPFLLRRVKADVETSLPPKREIVLYAPLTATQLEIEKKLVDKTLISEIQAQQKSGGRSACPLLSCTRPFTASASRSGLLMYAMQDSAHQLCSHAHHCGEDHRLPLQSERSGHSLL